MTGISLSGISINVPAPSGATYFINQSGSGNGDGSSLANAMSIANYNSGNLNASTSPGDTAYFCGALSTQITVGEGGSGGSYLTLSGDCSSQGGTDATIDRNGYGGSAYGIRATAIDYLYIQDFTITDAADGIEILGDCDYLTARRNLIYDMSEHAVLIGESGVDVSDHVTIGGASGDGNTIYDCGDDTAGSDIVVANSHTNVRISYNKILDLHDNDKGIGGIWIVNCNPGQGNETIIEYNEIGGHNDQVGDAAETGIASKYSSYLIIRRNYLHNESGYNSSILCSGIRTSGNSHHVWIHNNWINAYATGIHPNDAYSNSDGCGDGTHQQYIYIYNNLVSNTVNYGINVGTNGNCSGGTPTPDAVEYVYVWNNLLYNCANTPTDVYQAALFFADWDDRGRTHPVELKNNIIVNSRYGQALKHALISFGSSYFDFDYNTYYYTGQESTMDIYRWAEPATYYNLSEVQSTLSLEAHSNFRDPKLHDASNNLFYLDSDSNEIGAGQTQTCADGLCDDALDPIHTDWTTDPVTVSVIQQTAPWDRGAYKYNSE